MIEPFVHITGVASSVVLSIATKDLSVKQPINLAYPPAFTSPPPPYPGAGPAAALLAVSMDDTATTTTYLYTNTVQGICVLLYDNVEKKKDICDEISF